MTMSIYSFLIFCVCVHVYVCMYIHIYMCIYIHMCLLITKIFLFIMHSFCQLVLLEYM